MIPDTGGSRIQADPNNKKLIQLVAENNRLRLTLSARKGFNRRFPVIAIFLKIENLSDQPIVFDPSKYSVVNEEGRAGAGLRPDDAVKRVLDSTVLYLGSPTRDSPVERKISSDINRDSLQPGEIPPRSFKEGMVFFESPSKRSKTFRLTLGDLWPESFVYVAK